MVKGGKEVPRFRKRPVIIEAHQWFKNGDHPQDACYPITSDEGTGFMSEGKIVRYYRTPDGDGDRLCEHCNIRMHNHGWIDTLEGGHIVCPGDYVITGVVGEHYPIKLAILAKTYEPVDTVITEN